MCEVYFEDYVLLAISGAFDPGLMRSFQFFVKAETVLPQEICNVLVTPVAQSPRHDLPR